MTDTATKPPTVFQCLNDAVSSLGYVGKDGHNDNQGFSFRSIDGVVGATRLPLFEHGLSLIPSFKSLEQTDYVKDDGRVSHRSVLEGTFRVVGPGGDEFQFTMIGEAMDTEGRASNKATSAATKNAMIRLLQIGSGGDDGDQSDAVPHQRQASTPRPYQAPRPAQGGGNAGGSLAATVAG